MKKKRVFHFVLGCIFTIIFLGACGPPQDDREVISSPVAAETFSTQTAQIPTLTLTITPTEALVNQLGESKITPRVGKKLTATEAQEPISTLTPTEALVNQLGESNITPRVGDKLTATEAQVNPLGESNITPRAGEENTDATPTPPRSPVQISVPG